MPQRDILRTMPIIFLEINMTKYLGGRKENADHDVEENNNDKIPRWDILKTMLIIFLKIIMTKYLGGTFFM